jgi:hypothetical protein
LRNFIAQRSLDLAMRKPLVALTTLIATLALIGPASSATTVHAHALGAVRPFPSMTVWPYQGAWVARADATTIAWGSVEQGANASTVSDGGTVRSLPAQPGCAAKAAGGGHVAYDCGASYEGRYARLSTRVVALTGVVDGAIVATVPLDPGRVPLRPDLFVGNYTLDGIGTRWVHYTQSCFKYCAGTWSEDVDWRTGEAHKIATVDPSLYESLDARALTVPLCAPLRSDMASAAATEPWTVPVVLDRPWALLAGPPVAENPDDASWTVQRCGSSRPVSLPAGSTPVALGGGWLLLEKDGKLGPVRLLRLADHRLVTVTGAPATFASQAAHMEAAITSKRVVFSVHTGGTDRLYTARLPRR